jgi:hypothetical protein
VADFEEAWQRIGVASTVPAFEPHYASSPSVDGVPLADVRDRSSYALEARGGHHLAPQFLSNGRNVFEELGSGFTLLALGADDTAVRAIEASAQRRGVPLKVIRDTYQDGREQYGARLVIVRPDQFVAWTSNGDHVDDVATAIWQPLLMQGRESKTEAR